MKKIKDFFKFIISKLLIIGGFIFSLFLFIKSSKKNPEIEEKLEEIKIKEKELDKSIEEVEKKQYEIIKDKEKRKEKAKKYIKDR